MVWFFFHFLSLNWELLIEWQKVFPPAIYQKVFFGMVFFVLLHTFVSILFHLSNCYLLQFQILLRALNKIQLKGLTCKQKQKFAAGVFFSSSQDFVFIHIVQSRNWLIPLNWQCDTLSDFKCYGVVCLFFFLLCNRNAAVAFVHRN